MSRPYRVRVNGRLVARGSTESAALRLVAAATRLPGAFPGSDLADKLAAQRARCRAFILNARGLA